MYTTEKQIELNKTVNYTGFPGLMDKEFLVVGKKDYTADDKRIFYIINLVLSFYELTLEMLVFPSRKKIKVRAKHMCYYILFKFFRFQKNEIARKFNVDHTTVISGIKSIETQLSINNSLYSTELKTILQKLNK